MNWDILKFGLLSFTFLSIKRSIILFAATGLVPWIIMLLASIGLLRLKRGWWIVFLIFSLVFAIVGASIFVAFIPLLTVPGDSLFNDIGYIFLIVAVYFLLSFIYLLTPGVRKLFQNGNSSKRRDLSRR